MGASSKSRRKRWQEVAAETKKCPRCPPHSGENTTRKRPRSDKHKNKRR